MKTSLPDIRPVPYKSHTLLVFAMALIFSGSFGKNLPLKSLHNSNRDSITIFKQIVNKSYHVSIYPDADQKVVFFSVRGNEGKAYQLFLFDMDGKMVKQAEIRNKQTTVIKNIDKGVYLFEVFSDDSRIGNGRMTVR